MKRFIFFVFISLFLFFLFGSPLCAIDISVIGGLEDITVEPEHLFRGKSVGLAGSYESKEGATMINITGTAGTDDAWEVRVRMKASSWPKDMALQLRRDVYKRQLLLRASEKNSMGHYGRHDTIIF